MTTPCPAGRDSGLRGLGFLFRRRPHPRGELRVSDVAFAGSHGMTCRRDVPCRVDVPVVRGATGRATPRPGRWRRLGRPMPTGRAGLGTAGAGLVREVRAGGGDLTVCTRHLGLGVGPVVRAGSFAGHPPLVAGQVLLPPGRLPRISDPLPLGGDREVHAQIHPGHRTGSRCRFGVGDLDGEGDVPAAVRLPRDRHGRRLDPGGIDLGRGPHHLQRRVHHLHRLQAPLPPAERRPRVGRGLFGLPGFVSRVAGTPREEARERGVPVPKRLPQRHTGARRPGCGGGPAARSGICSTPGVHSRTYGSAPPAALGWGGPASRSSYARSNVS